MRIAPIDPHGHVPSTVTTVEMWLVTAGHCVVRAGRSRSRCGPTSVCWFFPGTSRRVEGLSRNAEGWTVRAGPDVLARCRAPDGGPGLGPAPRPALALAGQLSAAEQRWVYERLGELADLDPGAAETAVGLAYVLLHAWHRTLRPGVVSRKASPAVLRATRLLDAAAEDGPWTTTRVARVVGLSPAQLARRFRAETGTTVTGYRLRRQVERYLDLCDDDHRLSITDAAFAAGFGSYAQFHRVFVREMGLSPSAHRLRRRGG